MAHRELNLMISSRSDGFEIPDGNGAVMRLRAAREALKADLEAALFLDKRLLKVWINEREHGEAGQTAWDQCLAQARGCDLFISLYDGHAGWTLKGSKLGICQAEFDAAFNDSPEKVQVVRLPNATLKAGDVSGRSFLDALTSSQRFETQPQTDWPDIRAKIHSLVQQMVLGAAHEGIRQYRKSGPNLGQALNWSRMTFTDRSGAIQAAIASELAETGVGETLEKARSLLALRTIRDTRILFSCHGAPRSLSEATGREAVGRPFLNDHNLRTAASWEQSDAGPVHLVGCPKGVTELQALTLLGATDVTVVPGTFGVYAADRSHMVQVCLLAGCTDPGSTRNAVQRFLEWLERSGESEQLNRRARSRRRIVETIIGEMHPST